MEVNLLKSHIIFRTWPDVQINKNDSELQIFSRYFTAADKNQILANILEFQTQEEIKDIDLADEARLSGNKFYKIKDYKKALKLYNKSMLLAPRDSEVFALAVANRSAIFFEMEKYDDCLNDISILLKLEYPKENLYKILLRQGKCYIKQNKSFAAAKSIRRAQESVDNLKLDKKIKSSMTDKIKEIKEDLKVLLETKTSDKEKEKKNLSEVLLKDGENRKFLNASKCVDLRYSKKLGRHVVCNSDIKKGEVLLIESPYAVAAVPDTGSIFKLCANCLQTILSHIPCTACSRFLYCSDSCRYTDWTQNHQWVCLGLSRNIITQQLEHLSLGILFKASHDNFKDEVDDKNVYGNRDNNYAFLNKLLTHREKTPDRKLEELTKFAVWLVLYLKHFTNYFDWLYTYPGRPEGTKDEIYKFVGGQLIRYMLQMENNSVFISHTKINLNKSEVMEKLVGNAIFVSSSMLNHSCLPNAIQRFHGNNIVIKAIKEITKDTEITIDYFENQPYNQNNRQLIMNSLFINCCCQACTNPTFNEIYNPFLCQRCAGKSYPVAVELGLFKCSECNLVFTSFDYVMNVNKIVALMDIYNEMPDNNLLPEIYKLMQKVHHKYSRGFSTFYEVSLAQKAVTKDEIKRNLDIAILNKELGDNMVGIFGIRVNKYVLSLIHYVYLLIKYYKILRRENAANYTKYLKESEEVIEKTKNILTLYVSPTSIDNFVSDAKKYLLSESIEMDEDEDSTLE